MPDYYKVDNDVVSAYRNYYVGAKRKIAEWNKNRDVPTWFLMEIALPENNPVN